MEATRTIAVIRTRLPYIDRRALSEAWLAALRLASDRKSPSARKRSRRLCEGVGPRSIPHERGRAASATVAQPRPLASLEKRPSFAPPDRADLGRISRLRASASAAIGYQRARSYPPFRATFSLPLDGARVQILVRREGPTLHVLALCSARHVELVRRALACADLHLRARGEAVSSSVRALDEVVCA